MNDTYLYIIVKERIPHVGTPTMFSSTPTKELHSYCQMMYMNINLCRLRNDK